MEDKKEKYQRCPCCGFVCEYGEYAGPVQAPGPGPVAEVPGAALPSLPEQIAALMQRVTALESQKTDTAPAAGSQNSDTEPVPAVNDLTPREPETPPAEPAPPTETPQQ